MYIANYIRTLHDIYTFDETNMVLCALPPIIDFSGTYPELIEEIPGVRKHAYVSGWNTNGLWNDPTNLITSHGIPDWSGLSIRDRGSVTFTTTDPLMGYNPTPIALEAFFGPNADTPPYPRLTDIRNWNPVSTSVVLISSMHVLLCKHCVGNTSNQFAKFLGKDGITAYWVEAEFINEFGDAMLYRIIKVRVNDGAWLDQIGFTSAQLDPVTGVRPYEILDFNSPDDLIGLRLWIANAQGIFLTTNYTGDLMNLPTIDMGGNLPYLQNIFVWAGDSSTPVLATHDGTTYLAGILYGTSHGPVSKSDVWSWLQPLLQSDGIKKELVSLDLISHPSTKYSCSPNIGECIPSKMGSWFNKDDCTTSCLSTTETEVGQDPDELYVCFDSTCKVSEDGNGLPLSYCKFLCENPINPTPSEFVFFPNDATMTVTNASNPSFGPTIPASDTTDLFWRDAFSTLLGPRYRSNVIAGEHSDYSIYNATGILIEIDYAKLIIFLEELEMVVNAPYSQHLILNIGEVSWMPCIEWGTCYAEDMTVSTGFHPCFGIPVLDGSDPNSKAAKVEFITKKYKQLIDAVMGHFDPNQTGNFKVSIWGVPGVINYDKCQEDNTSVGHITDWPHATTLERETRIRTAANNWADIISNYGFINAYGYNVFPIETAMDPNTLEYRIYTSGERIIPHCGDGGIYSNPACPTYANFLPLLDENHDAIRLFPWDSSTQGFEMIDIIQNRELEYWGAVPDDWTWQGWSNSWRSFSDAAQKSSNIIKNINNTPSVPIIRSVSTVYSPATDVFSGAEESIQFVPKEQLIRDFKQYYSNSYNDPSIGDSPLQGVHFWNSAWAFDWAFMEKSAAENIYTSTGNNHSIRMQLGVRRSILETLYNVRARDFDIAAFDDEGFIPPELTNLGVTSWHSAEFKIDAVNRANQRFFHIIREMLEFMDLYTAVSYNCVNNACQITSGTSGTWSTLEDCQQNCFISSVKYKCFGTGVSAFCDESITGTYNNITDCLAQCSSPPLPWSCIEGNCVEIDGRYISKEACLADECGITPPILTYDCIAGICVQVAGPGGRYATEAACQLSCAPPVSWNCIASTCVQVAGPDGRYPTEEVCRRSCTSTFSYNCINKQCVPVLGNPAGTYPNIASCNISCGTSPPPPPPSDVIVRPNSNTIITNNLDMIFPDITIDLAEEIPVTPLTKYPYNSR